MQISHLFSGTAGTGAESDDDDDVAANLLPFSLGLLGHVQRVMQQHLFDVSSHCPNSEHGTRRDTTDCKKACLYMQDPNLFAASHKESGEI